MRDKEFNQIFFVFITFAELYRSPVKGEYTTRFTLKKMFKLY